MNYRLYRDGDFPQLYAIEERCFDLQSRFSRPYMRSLVLVPTTATWIAEEATRMAGFAIVQWIGGGADREAYIQTIEVDPAFRNHGIGAGLLNLLEGSARAQRLPVIWLHVDESNDAAIRLYRRHEYECTGSHPNYYAPGRSAAIYVKKLALKGAESPSSS